MMHFNNFVFFTSSSAETHAIIIAVYRQRSLYIFITKSHQKTTCLSSEIMLHDLHDLTFDWNLYCLKPLQEDT